MLLFSRYKISRMKMLPFPTLLILPKFWRTQHFYTKTNVFWNKSLLCFKTGIFKTGNFLLPTWIFFRPILFLPCWRWDTFICHVNEEKKHSIVGSQTSAIIIQGVFSFTVYIPALKTQGQILTKEVFSQTGY